MSDSTLPIRSTNAPRQDSLVGRARELGQLTAELERALSGEARLLLVAGEPGIGKTRTAEEVASQAAAKDMAVLWGRCPEAEGTPPYWSWVQILRTYAQLQSPEALRDQLEHGAADVVQIVPEIGLRLRDLPPLPVLPPEQVRFRAFDHITAFLRRAAEAHPLLLVIDDLHWADVPSLLLLEFVAREAAGVPLVILGTYRDTELGRQHPLSRTISEFVRTNRCARVTLRGLQQADVGSLVAAAGVAARPALVAAVFDETAGNPFFVQEVVRLLASDAVDIAPAEDERVDWHLPLPQSVRDVIGRRLDRLSTAGNKLLSVASVIGREFALPVLARVRDETPEQTLEVLDEAVRAQIVEPMSRRVGRYRFGHALIRETLYDELSTIQKMRLHRQVGLALEAHYRHDLASHLAELAHHFVEAAPAGDVSRAASYAQRAGQQAMALLAFEDAAHHFEMALQVLDLHDAPDDALRCDLCLLLAGAHISAGDAAMGRQTYLRAAHLARASGLPEALARAALGYGGEPIAAWGFDADLVRLLEDALTLLGPQDHPLRAQLLNRLSIELVNFDPERMTVLHRDAEAMARRIGDPRTLAFTLIGRIHYHLEHYDGWEAFLATSQEMAELSAAVGDRGLMWSAACGRLCGLLLAGDRTAIDRQIDVCARIADESHHPFYLFWTPTLRVLQALLDGRFAETERHLADAVALVPRAHLAHWELWYAPNLFALRREQGRPGDAEQALREAIADVPDPDRDLTYQAMLALALIETGRSEEARREFEALTDDVCAFAQGRDVWSTNLPHALGYLAEVCVALGDAPRAAILHDLLMPYAGQNLVYGGAWHVAGSASHFLGLLATTLERWNEAVRQFEDALTMHGHLEAAPLVAHTQVAYATMLLQRNGAGDREHAFALAEAALDTASQLGMVHLANQATALRATLAARRASEAVMAIERTGLTERELDVLRLVAAGQSNPQIAEALFISRATVRTHVSNILAKLDVRSRAEAVDSAHRHGLLIPDDLPTT